MSFCPSCGTQLSEEESKATFCAHCGKPLEEAAPVVEETASEEPVNNEPVVEAPASDSEQTQQEKTPLFDVDDIKEKVLPALDNLVEKAKAVPALEKLLSKLDKQLYPVLLAIPVALLVLIIVVVMLVSSSGSYMTPLNDYMKWANKKNTNTHEAIYSLSPDFRVDLMKKVMSAASKSDEYEDMLKDAEDELEDMYDALDDEFDSWKIGFEVKSQEKMDKDDVEDLQDEANDRFDDYYESSLDYFEDALDDDDDLEDLADSMDVSEKEAEAFLKAYIKYYESFEDVKITEAYEVKGKFTIKADKDEWKSETVKVIFVKINGDWAYAGLDGDDYITFDDDDEEIALFNSFFYLLQGNYIYDAMSSIY